MARYDMPDGTLVDTANASQSWDEQRDWDGNNNIGRSSGSQWSHQTLHRSRKGRYYLETRSNYQGVMPRAEWLSPQAAARWLLLNEEELPEDLRAVAEEVTE